MTNETIKTLIAQVCKASVAAGEAILEVYNSDNFFVETKEDNSPLTLADKKSHEELMRFLEQTEIPILSEEGQHAAYAERKNWDFFWLVDPLDGTKEFIKRNNEFTVNVALIHKRRPIAGVIYVPVYKQLYFSIEEIGAFKIENIAGNSKQKYDFSSLKSNAILLPISKLQENRKYTVVGSRSHMSDENKQFIAKLKTQVGELEFMSKGSSLKLCMVAEGAADIYPRLGPTMEWDTAAGHAIVLGAKGTVIHFDTKMELLYNKENLLNPYFIVKRK